MNAPQFQPTNAPATNDADHLRLLSIFHYVYAGLTALFACIPIFHVVFGIALMQGALPFDAVPQEGQKELKPEDLRMMGMMFVGIGSVFIVMGWMFAALLAIAGRKLAARRGRTYCIVIAALSCMMVPLGTILGVFTLIVLMRPSVQALFAAPERMQPF